jgi:hypothetical protein
MGWWIFKSAREKYMGQLVKRLDRIEGIMGEDLEDEELARIENRLGKIEKMLTEDTETPTTPATPDKAATVDKLNETATMIRSMWARVPAGIKPVVNRYVEGYLGKSVEDLLADSQTVEQIAAVSGAALKGLAQTAKKKTPAGLEPLDVERAMPLDARGNVMYEKT